MDKKFCDKCKKEIFDGDYVNLCAWNAKTDEEIEHKDFCPQCYKELNL